MLKIETLKGITIQTKQISEITTVKKIINYLIVYLRQYPVFVLMRPSARSYEYLCVTFVILEHN